MKPAASFRFWLPSLILPAVAVYIIAASLSVRIYPMGAHRFHGRALTVISWACAGLAVLLAVLPKARCGAVEHLDALEAAPRRLRRLWLGLAFLGFLTWACFIRFCQYRYLIIPGDSVNSVNNAYNFIHHGVLEYTIWGVKNLAIHFQLLPAAFSPVLLFWGSPLALLLVQNLFLCSTPFAAFALARQLTASSFAGFIALLLTLSTPYLSELLYSDLQNNSLAAFLPWAAYFYHRRNWTIVGAFVVLMVCSQEQVPFIFFGLGLYAVHAFKGRRPWNWILGFGLCAAAAALWLGEMAVIRHYQTLEAGNYPIDKYRYWSNYAHMSPGTPPERLSVEVLTHPFRTLWLMVSNIYRFYPVARVLFFSGLLPLLAPWQTIPFWITALPQIVANPGQPMDFLFPADTHSKYYALGFHYSAYVFGPMVWALAHGVSRAYAWLSPGRRQGWLLVWALGFAALGWRCAPAPLQEVWRAAWFYSMPRIAAKIPPKARLWVADDFDAMPLSHRRWLKLIFWGPEAPWGFQRLFAPDYVLIDHDFFIAAKPPFRDQILTYLAQGKYEKTATDLGLVLLKAPQTAADPESVPEWISLPKPDAKAAQAYGDYLYQGADWNGLVEHSREAADFMPGNPLGHTQLAVYLHLAGKSVEAAQRYREALRLAPNFAPARTNLSALIAQHPELSPVVPQLSAAQQAALARFAEAARADPTSMDPYNGGGTVLLEAGQVDEAIRHFRQAAELAPGQWGPHYNLGLAFTKKGDMEAAAEQYREAIRLNPSDGNAYNNLAVILVGKGQVDAAIAQLRLAVAADPGFERARANLALLLKERKQ